MRALLITNGTLAANRRYTGAGDAAFAVMFNSCIHESGYMVVSLHRTRLGAWRAKQRHQWKLEMDAARETRTDQWCRKDRHWRRVDPSSGFMIAMFPINNDSLGGYPWQQ